MPKKVHDHIEVYKGWFRLPSLDWIRISEIAKISCVGFRLDKSMIILKDGTSIMYSLSCRSIIDILTEEKKDFS